MSPDASERLSFLADTLDLLWPGMGSSPRDRGMTVVPNVRAPRLLVPMRPRRAAARAVRRYTAQQGTRERAGGIALGLLVRAGWCDRLPRANARVPGAETIDDHLSEVLETPVVTALALTRERPNRKPVLFVFDSAGRLVAFAKVGVSPLAARLVDAEAAALRRLGAAAPTALTYPQVRGHGRWRGLPVLVTAPLALGRAPRSDDARLADAMAAVSAIDAGSTGSYLEALRARAVEVGAASGAWRDLFEATAAVRDLAPIEVGSWHGDWTAWNCARRGAQIAVWDWERFTAPAPVGFDMLHFVLNGEVKGRRDRFGPAAAELVAEAPRLLSRWRLSADAARTTALLYILDIALRYVADDLRSTDPGGRVEQWAFPLVRSHLSATTQPEPL